MTHNHKKMKKFSLIYFGPERPSEEVTSYMQTWATMSDSTYAMGA